MNLKEELRSRLIEFSEEDSYKGMHSAPVKSEENAPMYDVSEIFPDMYTENALRYYGGYDLDDAYCIRLIQSVRNRPKATIEVYRAIPYENKEIDVQVKKLNEILSSYYKFRFFPQNKIIDDIQRKYYIEDKGYTVSHDELNKLTLEELNRRVDELNASKTKRIKMNSGDWVTISKLYAKQHGESNLNNNYKIIKKTVTASQLYTDGNSIFEWGVFFNGTK